MLEGSQIQSGVRSEATEDTSETQDMQSEMELGARNRTKNKVRSHEHQMRRPRNMQGRNIRNAKPDQETVI